MNLAHSTGDRFFSSLLSLLYLTCGSARIVVLTLEKQHVFDRADPIMPPLSYSKRDCRGILPLTTAKKYSIFNGLLLKRAMLSASRAGGLRS